MVPIYVIETTNGEERGVWGIHQVLRDEMAKAQPQPGDRIGIRFQGDLERKSKGGYSNTYKGYKVQVIPKGQKDAHIDWSLFGAKGLEIAPADDADDFNQDKGNWSDEREASEIRIEADNVDHAGLIRNALNRRDVSLSQALTAAEAAGLFVNSVGEMMVKASAEQQREIAARLNLSGEPVKF